MVLKYSNFVTFVCFKKGLESLYAFCCRSVSFSDLTLGVFSENITCQKIKFKYYEYCIFKGQTNTNHLKS